ncbi:hypothetical protein ACEQPO_09515 [Bacillus sp. SL00103]
MIEERHTRNLWLKKSKRKKEVELPARQQEQNMVREADLTQDEDILKEPELTQKKTSQKNQSLYKNKNPSEKRKAARRCIS